MLVLTRKENEEIVIDGGIVITIIQVDRGKVRIGIQAPNGTNIYRKEIMQRYCPDSIPPTQSN